MNLLVRPMVNLQCITNGPQVLKAKTIYNKIMNQSCLYFIHKTRQLHMTISTRNQVKELLLPLSLPLLEDQE